MCGVFLGFFFCIFGTLKIADGRAGRAAAVTALATPFGAESDPLPGHLAAVSPEAN